MSYLFPIFKVIGLLVACLELSLINRYFYPQKIEKLTLSFLNENLKGSFTFEITYLNEKVHNYQ